MLIVDKHCSDVCCDEFPVLQIRKSKQVKEQWHEKFICIQYGENSLFWTPKISKLVDE